jgi:hypothetical protein
MAGEVVVQDWIHGEEQRLHRQHPENSSPAAPADHAREPHRIQYIPTYPDMN